ncbi:DMT family transporter [Maioricimonas sp. JC845]|uniref:DMT family transporter n=1 Tax=Maioricimonas sp. JC845 TaxID=3232138 RepID=UPI0034591406
MESSSPSHRSVGVLGAALALLTAMLWGGTAVSNRIAVDTLPPVFVGGVRFGLATLFMVAWCRLEGCPITITRSQIRPVTILGVLLFLQISTFNWGLERSNSSHGTLFVNTFVFWVAAFEHFLLRTYRLRAVQLCGLLLAAGGVVLLLATTGDDATTQRDVPTMAGDLFLLLSGFLLAIKVVFTRSAVNRMASGTLILWHDLIGTVLFFVYAATFEDFSHASAPPGVVAALLYAGLAVSGFCFAAQAWLLRHHSASQISVFSFATPVFGVAAGVMIRGDNLSSWLFLSGLCVAMGIVLVNRRGNGGGSAPRTENVEAPREENPQSAST